ncbi:hypothetical protein HMI55_000319 [Coelomomyces lativittatus]|nr:hypothetical protein HMI55_000319 [Coelomomyces lativittatus]
MNSDRWEHDLFDQPETNLPEFPRTHAMDFNKEVMGLPHLTLENLHWQVTEKDLENMLQMYTVVRVALRYDHGDRSTGIADIYFKSKSDAQKAYEEMDGKELHCQIVSAKQAPPLTPRRNDPKSRLRRTQSAFPMYVSFLNF